MCDFGYGLLQGRRLVQEDVVILESLGSSDECFIYASVFDGHLGISAAKFASTFVFDKLKALLRNSNPSAIDFETFLVSALRDADDAFLRVAKERGLKDGSTATIAVLHDRAVTVANVGDSRGILVRGPRDDGRGADADPAPAPATPAPAAGEAAAAHEPVPLTVDHRPDLPEERSRIEAAGGRVEHARGAWRVQVCNS